MSQNKDHANMYRYYLCCKQHAVVEVFITYSTYRYSYRYVVRLLISSLDVSASKGQFTRSASFCRIQDPESGSVLGMLGNWTKLTIRIQEQGNWTKLTNKIYFQPLKMASVPKWVCFMTKYLHKVYGIFHVKITTFRDGKVWPGSGSALVWLPESGSGLR